MKRGTLLTKQLLLIAALLAGTCGAALANRGGDSGDSSMNPFTGDSYAYFHGGHNLGELGTIRPDRPPPPKSKPVWGRTLSRAPDSGATAQNPAYGRQTGEQRDDRGGAR